MNSKNVNNCKKTCCITGHRKIPIEKFNYVKEELKAEILFTINDGYTHFISGFADGIDLLFANMIADIKINNQNITLEAAIPYRNRVNSGNTLFKGLLEKCDIVGVHSEKYTQQCYFKRNRFMVDKSNRVIAVYDGRYTGGTYYIINYARLHRKEIKEIRI